MTIERIDSLTLLHPEFARRVKALDEELTRLYETGRTETHFKLFETFRHPARQARLLTQRTSKARPWESAHQWGLAVDFVPYIDVERAKLIAEDSGIAINPGWNWDSSHDYSLLATTAKQFQLSTPISWDPCHVESSDWPEFRKNLGRVLREYLINK